MKNANKGAVKSKLHDSLDYCNSHHVPVQPLFEELVDELVSKADCPYEPTRRATEMKALFPVLFQRDTEGMIPSIPLPEDSLTEGPEAFLRLWLSKWTQKFLAEWRSLPSNYISQPKGTVTDPALIKMVMASAHAGDLETAYEWAGYHNLFMSAENVGGNLLEEYIAKKIQPYGWIWCRGKILTAVDFCNDTCTAKFQVKNKTNTENSSSKGFREAAGAPVWCRMRDRKFNRQVVTYWPELVKIVRDGATCGGPVPEDLMSEEDYLGFVERVSENNPLLITAFER